MKARLFAYVRERLAGFEAKPPPSPPRNSGRRKWRPSGVLRTILQPAYDGRKHRANHSNGLYGAGELPGQAAIRTDIDNLRAAVVGVNPESFHAGRSAERCRARTSTTARDEEYLPRWAKRSAPSIRRSSRLVLFFRSTTPG